MKNKKNDLFEFRAVVSGGEVEGRTLKGYASVFDSPSLYMGFREYVRKGTFTKTIKESDIRALWNHDDSKVLGRISAGTLRLSEDDKGLKVEIDLPDTTIGNDALESIRRGDVTQMSFRFQTIKDNWFIDESDGITCRELLEVRLMEVSPVTFPAYPDTIISARAVAQAASELNDGASAAVDSALYKAMLKLKTGADLTDGERTVLNNFADELRKNLSHKPEPVVDHSDPENKPPENTGHLVEVDTERMGAEIDLIAEESR